MALCTLWLFVLLIVSYGKLQKLSEFIESESDKSFKQRQALFTKTFLKFYTGFSLTFHVENDTVLGIDYLLKLLHDDSFGDIMVLNHDILNPNDFKKPNGVPFLHLVVLNNPRKYSSFLVIPECLVAEDVVVFIIRKNNKWTKENFWDIPKLNWAGNIIILNVSDTEMHLYNLCFYCGKYTRQLHRLPTTNYTQMKTSFGLLPRKFNDFQGHRFQIGYVNSFPHMLCEKSVDKKIDSEVIRKCKKAIGLEMGILGVLSEKLNFKYTLIETTYALTISDDDINKEGFPKLDFIIGAVSMTSARIPKMAFTSSFALEPYTFLYIPRKRRWIEVLDNLRPFRSYVWISVLFSIIWFSLVLYLSVKATNKNNRCFSVSRCFKICSKAIIEQTERVKAKSIRRQLTPYIILSLWWLISLIITTAYKSKLWAISIKNYHVEPSDLEQLLDDGYKIVTNSENIDIIDDLLNVSDPVIQRAKNNFSFKNKTCNTLAYILKNKAAMLDEYGTIQHHTSIRCSTLLKQDIYSKLRITKTPLRYATHSWPLRMGAPYKQTFNIWMGRMLSTGLKSKWMFQALSAKRSQYNPIAFSQTTIDDKIEEKEVLQGFVSSFAIYITGNIIALCCFAVEVIYTKISIRRNKTLQN